MFQVKIERFRMAHVVINICKRIVAGFWPESNLWSS